MEVPFRILITKLLLLTSTVGFSSFNNVIKYNQNVIYSSKTLKVLMIGNSFTFYWNLPQVIECMLNAQNTSFEVDQKTIGGSNLGKHWWLNSEKDYSINNYNYLVLNDHSTNPLEKIDSCAKYIKLFTELAKKSNTTPLIYGTWEYPYLRDI